MFLEGWEEGWLLLLFRCVRRSSFSRGRFLSVLLDGCGERSLFSRVSVESRLFAFEGSLRVLIGEKRRG